ncbi:MAG: HAMP domain-containing histidine kinase, partial [Spirochaetes bacterium]|nr:HAMP domain-containing histidine kinase [Spirochaetota bacterium]
AKKINFDFKIELFEWINYSLPDDSVKFNYSILKNDFSYVDSEIGGYFFEFIKILSGDDDILKKVAEMNVSDSVKILALGLSIKKMFQLYSYFSGIHDNTANYKFIKFEENIAIIQRRPVEEFCNSVGIYFRANIRNCCDLAISTSRAYTKKLFLIEIKEVEETKCAKNKNDFCEYKFTWNKKKLIKLSFFINLFISLTTSCFIFILLKFLISSIFLQRFTSIVIFVLTFYNISIWKYIKKLKQIIEAQREKNQKDYNLLQNINLELIKEKNTLEQKVADRTQQLQQSKTEIETINQQRKNYFIDFAHEMKTPLTLIWNLLISVTKKHLNFAVKIGDSKELNAIKSDLAIIKNNVGKLKTDTINYLDIEKLEKGEMIYDHSSIIDINDVLQNKIPLFKETAKIKNIGIKLVSKENFFIKCDGTAIDRIINNMLVNAIKYTNNGGSIDVLLKNVNDKIELIVKDTGIGISDEQKEFIFKPFYQIPYQKQQIQGMGIGLSLVRKIVNEVKGEIKVESRLSKGSTFTILFHKHTLLKNDVVQKDINYSTPIINILTKQLISEEYKEGRKNILAVED